MPAAARRAPADHQAESARRADFLQMLGSDVTALGDDMFAINHDVFATERSLIDDLGRLVISGIHPPHIRSPRIRKVPERNNNPRYWRYVP
jgi:hypothetical protein